MELHELQDLDFDDALSLLEERLETLRLRVADAEKQAGDDEVKKRAVADLYQQHSDALEMLNRYREMKAQELAGERDNLLTEMLGILDEIGNKVDRMVS